MAESKKKGRRPTKVYKAYKVTGGKLERKNKFCPKCGPGVYLGLHKNRMYCGKCHYMETI